MSISPCRRDGCKGPDSNPNLTTGVFCAGCTDKLRSALLALPELYVHLYLALEPSGQPGQRVSGSKTPPLPLRVNVSTLMTDITRALEDWEDYVRGEQNLSERDDRGREGVSLTTAVRILVGHLDTLLAAPTLTVNRWDYSTDSWTTVDLDGADAGNEILELHHQARRVLGQTRLVHRLPVPCPGCDTVGTLIRKDGSDQVECGACGEAWPESDYRRLTLVLASEAAS